MKSTNFDRQTLANKFFYGKNMFCLLKHVSLQQIIFLITSSLSTYLCLSSRFVEADVADPVPRFGPSGRQEGPVDHVNWIAML